MAMRRPVSLPDYALITPLRGRMVLNSEPRRFSCSPDRSRAGTPQGRVLDFSSLRSSLLASRHVPFDAALNFAATRHGAPTIPRTGLTRMCTPRTRNQKCIVRRERASFARRPTSAAAHFWPYSATDAYTADQSGTMARQRIRAVREHPPSRHAHVRCPNIVQCQPPEREPGLASSRCCTYR